MGNSNKIIHIYITCVHKCYTNAFSFLRTNYFFDICNF